MDVPRQQLTTYRCYNKEELLVIRESNYCRTRPVFLSKDFDNDDGLFSPDKWLQHKWKCEGVENRVRRKAASQTSAGSGGGGGSVSGNSTATVNTPQQESDKQQANIKAARLRRGASTTSNGMDFKPDFQKSALEATCRTNRGSSSQNTPNIGGNGTSWSSTATTSKHGSNEKSRTRRGAGDRARKPTERRRSSNMGEEPLPEWMDEGPESAFDIIELMGFEEDIQSEKEVNINKTVEEQHNSSPETVLPSLPMTLATSRLKQWMGEGAVSEPKALADDSHKFAETTSRCASSNNASSSGGGSIGPPKQIQQHIPFYEPSFDGLGMSPMPGPAGFYPHNQQPMGPPFLPPSRSPQPQFPPLPPPLANNSNIAANRSFLSSPVFLANSQGNHPQQGVHPLQMRHPFFGPAGPGGMGLPPMPSHGFLHHHPHVQQQQPLFPPYLSPSRSPQTQFPPPPLVNSNNNQISSASRPFINSPSFMPNHGNHPQQGVHPLQMRHPFFVPTGPGGMGMPPMPPTHGLPHHQQQPVMPAHLPPPSRSPQTQFPPPPPLVNSNNQISASRSNHFNQNFNLLNSPAFMPTSVMRHMSKVPGGGAISSTGCSETGSSTPNQTFPSGRSNIPPALEKIFASVRNQQTPDRSMLVRAILGQGHGPEDPSFSCSR
ncbi:hypothetical protein niasHS_000530 [Heterodera schachtii]|uniref:Uncharacterized protein n=1 Tax=Heterodera schachtii TaxID=97005 RepID=A0ABD2K4X6_HETSC